MTAAAGRGVPAGSQLVRAMNEQLPLGNERVRALGVDSVVNGCLASGLDRAWESLTSGSRA